MHKQRIYASLLALGAGFLLYRTITMISQGALSILLTWVSILLIAELLIDFSCLIATVPWWIKNDRRKATFALRLGAAATFMHAFRVLVFVLGRTGPWYNFDVRPDLKEIHEAGWTWAGVYFAASMSALSIIAVLIIWYYIIRASRKMKMKNEK